MKKKGLQIDNMATYRIKVQGTLDEGWAAHLHGLDIETEAMDEDELPVTLLTGQLADQDALKKVLNNLYNQRLPILSLEYLEEDEAKSWQAINDEDYVAD